MLAYSDTVRATPRNEYLGALADLIAQSYSPVRTQQMQGTARFLSMPAISETLDRLSYGEPLTTGAGMTTRVRPEALEAAMAVAPVAQPVTMASLQAARAARQAALQAGRAGERYAERVVPGIMERGGMPAQMLQDLAQGTQRQVFIGSKSRAWDKSAAELAKELEKKGEAPETIWQTTGTFKSPDGKWRQEISDQSMQLRTGSFGKDKEGNPITYQVTEGNASQVLAHPELYNAYPFLKKVNTEIGIRPKTAGSAEYGDEGRFVEAFGPTDDEIKSALIHEMQHQIQNREGMASGAGFMAGDQQSFQNYLRAAGEAEARAVQARRNMSMQERRNLFPLNSYDVPINELNSMRPQKLDFGFLGANEKNQNMLSYRGSHKAPGPDFGAPSIVREGNPIQSAVVLIGDKIFTGRTHTDAFNRAIYEGVIRKENGKFIYPKDAEVNSDLFMTKGGQIIDRIQASKMFDIGASETAIKEGLMQNKPASSMSVDSYMEQAKALKKQNQ